MATPERRLGAYVLGPTLGQGGFSKVKLGTHFETGNKVALKILKKDRLNVNSSTRKQVEREIRAMEHVRHRNVIRLLEVDWDCRYPKKNGTIIDVILVILELATGGELFEFLSFTGCFEELVARTYFKQLIEGVEACHLQGIAHRDLKPENLLLDSKFVLKLADFGFANLISGNRLMFTECGTPGYMAPEMFRANNPQGYDPTCGDIWACGVILFIMLAGFPPFQKPSDDDWWFNKLNHNKHALFWQAHCRSAYFSDTTKDFINKILSTDPHKRITIANLKNHEWFHGPTISDEDTQAEMARRKVKVDEERRRVRAERKGDQGPQAVRGYAQDHEVTRGMPDMPDAPPSIHMFGMGADAADTFSSQPSVGVDPSAGSAHAMPKPYVVDESVSCYTRLESNRPPTAILNRICDSIARLGGRFAVSESEYRIKASIVTENGPVTIRSQIYARVGAPSSAPVYVCEFRRLSGDSMQYLRLFRDLERQLDDLLLKDLPSSTQSTAPVEVLSSANGVAVSISPDALSKLTDVAQ